MVAVGQAPEGVHAQDLQDVLDAHGGLGKGSVVKVVHARQQQHLLAVLRVQDPITALNLTTSRHFSRRNSGMRLKKNPSKCCSRKRLANWSLMNSKKLAVLKAMSS